VKDKVLDLNLKKVGDIDLSDEIFAAQPNRKLIYEVVKMQRAGRRQGSAMARNRALVSGTTAKMYRQKGTGRARHGDERANIFVGGGKSFGPKPRDYSYRLPKKARRSGLRSALSLKKREGKLLIVDALSFPSIKTKDAVSALSKLGVKNGLLVVDGPDEKLEKSVRNIPDIKLVRWEGLNVYDLLRYEHAVVTVSALQKVQEVLKP
jgi:large subunit ribosomal protein L4